MEESFKEQTHHTIEELKNSDNALDIVLAWKEDQKWPSSFYIIEIHKSVLAGIDSYSKKGVSGILPGVYRPSDIWLNNEPRNFYVRGTDVTPLMREYSQLLDDMIYALPESAANTVELVVCTAAKVYYIFIRIHPFFDGNGRTGRLILNRILIGAGLPLLSFNQDWYLGSRDLHLDAMNLVDSMGSLEPLELYILQALKNKLNGVSGRDELLEEIDTIIKVKEAVIYTSNVEKSITNIWIGFKGIDISGGDEERLDTTNSEKVEQ